PVCPSGVRYGSALEAAREVLAAERKPPLAARLVLTAMADPSLRRPAMAAARAVRSLAGIFAGKSRFGFGMGMLAATAAADKRISGRADKRAGEKMSGGADER